MNPLRAYRNANAAALDSRITRVIAEDTLLSYDLALKAPFIAIYRTIILPGVLLKYDTPDLIEAVRLCW